MPYETFPLRFEECGHVLNAPLLHNANANHEGCFVCHPELRDVPVGGKCPECVNAAFFKRIFLSEVEWQSAVALEAMTRLRESLPDPPARANPERAFFFVQAFLAAAGNVSKLLWNQQWGEELRRTLNVRDDSAIADRTLRNHFEHFDERIERWAAKSTNHIFIDRNIFSGTRGFTGVERMDGLRNLNSSTLTITFWGEGYNLPQVEEALKNVHDLAQQKKLVR